jgi:hypothetical protein
MKAITVWQPYASLIAAGLKPYEFRGWRPPVELIGQRFAIHAAARRMRAEELHNLMLDVAEACLLAEAESLLEGFWREPARAPLSVVLCTAILDVPRKGAFVAADFGAPSPDSDEIEKSNWAWPLTQIELIDPPRPARGLQKFWEWNP